MRTCITTTPPPVSLHAFDSRVSDCDVETQQIGSANRVSADYLYQAATIAAAILVLMSI